MTTLYRLGQYRYEAIADALHGVVFRLVKAGRRKPSPGQLSLLGDAPVKGPRKRPKDGDTRINRAGNQEVLRSGRWRRVDGKKSAPSPQLSIISDDAIPTQKQRAKGTWEPSAKPSTAAATAWRHNHVARSTLHPVLSLDESDEIFDAPSPAPDAPLPSSDDYAYNQGEDKEEPQMAATATAPARMSVEDILAIAPQQYQQEPLLMEHWGTKSLVMAKGKEEYMSLANDSQPPVAAGFVNNVFQSIEVDAGGNPSQVGISPLVVVNGPRRDYVASREAGTRPHWGQLLDIPWNESSQYIANDHMMDFVAQKKSELASRMSSEDFRSKWAARLNEPKEFLGGDPNQRLDEFTPSMAGEYMFGPVGVEFFRNGWSMKGKSGAAEILGMSIAEIVEYYDDMAHTEGIPFPIRALYSDMSKEAAAAAKSTLFTDTLFA